MTRGRAELSRHWDSAYESRGTTGVSWYLARPTTSLGMIERLDVPKSAAVVDIGGGASTFVDELVARGFTDLTVLDVSSVALAAVHHRLGAHAPVVLLQLDLLDWVPDRQFDLWHDRAVFHFLVDEADRDAYLAKLDSAVAPGGAVVLATFAPEGPEYCSGLPVSRYGGTDLARCLGPGFQVVREVRERHVTPTGAVQPFTWVAARRSDRAGG